MGNIIVCGHGAGDPGAEGNGTNEAIQTRKLGQAIQQASGGKIALYDVNKDLFRTNDHASLRNYDVTEIHFNAFDGNARGCEVLIKNGFEPDVKDNAILSVLAKYFSNRGFKYRDDLANMNNFARMGTPYRLIEVCFIDNGEDMAIYGRQFANLAKDLSVAICGSATSQPQTPSAPTPQPSAPSGLVPQNGKFRIGVDGLRVRSAPSLSAEVVASYDAGQTVQYDHYIDAEGIRWVSYIGASGIRRYIARRRLDNSEIYGECY